MDVTKQFQQFMQKGFVMLVPSMLIGGAIATAVWRWSIEDGFARKTMLKGFMVLVTLQLLPLGILKVKTWICTDRVSLVPMALVKTVMMHVFLQCLRLVHHCITTSSPMLLEQFVNVVALIAAIFLLDQEFDLPLLRSPKAALNMVLTQHKDVTSLMLGACAAGIGTEWLYPSASPFASNLEKNANVIVSIGNFMEILSFIPAVKMVCMETGVESYTPGTSVQESERRKVKIFMAFILGFYLWDDVIYCVLMMEDSVIAAAKCAHFFMLLDFAGFFIIKVGAQPKFVEEMLPSVVPAAVESHKTDEQMQGLLGADDEEDPF